MMKCYKLILSVMFFVIFFSAPAVEADILKERIAFYKTCLNDMALHCKKMCRFKHSSSDPLRKCAELAEQKRGFIIKNGDDLITKMLAENIELKGYKVKYYVNKRFYGATR